MKKSLEFFRNNNFGEISLIISNRGNGEIKFATAQYNYFAIHAFYNTVNDIKDLEASKEYINNGRNTLPAVAHWFLSMESFFNCLIKICCYKLDEDFERIKKRDLSTRLSELLRMLELEEIKKTGIYGKINEFMYYRNELFHDRNVGEEINIQKTLFSRIPVLSNQIDVFQALLIYLEIMSLLRYSIKGLDLMPNISIGTVNSYGFEKLDNLYLSYLKPYFESVLVKHGLSTELDLNMKTYNKMISPVFQSEEVAPVIKVEHEKEFVYPVNTDNTDFGYPLLMKVIEQRGIIPGVFPRPDFISR